MIIKEQDRQIVIKENSTGKVIQKIIATKEQTLDKTRLFANVTLKKGCEVLYHNHIDEEEIYLINKGKAIYNDNGKEYEVTEGDVTICEDGNFHGIKNVNDEDLVFTAIIILK